MPAGSNQKYGFEINAPNREEKNKFRRTLSYSNVLIAPCSTADPGIAGAVLLQNKPNTKIERLIILD